MNLFYPVGSVYATLDASFNPNVAWGGTWSKVETGRFLEASSGAEVGTKTEAGLPNITGSINGGDATVGTYNTSASGAFYGSGSRRGMMYGRQGTDVNSPSHGDIAFDASRSSSIYGKSTTVQPASIKVVMWKRTA